MWCADASMAYAQPKGGADGHTAAYDKSADWYEEEFLGDDSGGDPIGSSSSGDLSDPQWTVVGKNATDLRSMPPVCR
jgi:hypothetical protein